MMRMNTDYDNFQLDWMMENDHSIDDIIAEIDARDEYRSIGLSNAYKQWIDDGGFQDDGIWPSEDEFLYSGFDYTIGERPFHREADPIYYHLDDKTLHLSRTKDHDDVTYHKVPNMHKTHWCKDAETVVFDDRVKLPWNVESMFAGMSKLETIRGMDKVDASDVEVASYMFSNCHALKNVDGIESWETPNLRTTNGMFSYCRSIPSLDLSGWKTTSLEYASRMFSGCKQLTSLDLSGWNLNKLKTGKDMFKSCNSLANVRMDGAKIPNTEFLLYNTADRINGNCYRDAKQPTNVADETLTSLPQPLRNAISRAVEKTNRSANGEMSLSSIMATAAQYNPSSDPRRAISQNR